MRAIFALPLLNAIYREQEIRIFIHIGRHVNHAGRADKLLRVDFVNAVFRQILAANPVDGRINVSSRMLARFKAVPVPGRATIIIVGKLPDFECPRIGPLRRKRKQ